MSALSRRRLLAATAGVSAVAAGATVGLPTTAHAAPAVGPTAAPDIEPFHGPHQGGVATPAQTHARWLAFDLVDDVDRDGLGRLMRLLSDDAERLTAGRGALADNEPELASRPGRLTVTFGVGPGFVERAGAAVPASLRPLPAFTVDRLLPRWSDGDLVVQVCGDDPVSLAHASRQITKDTRTFAEPRWVQRGFLPARAASTPDPVTRALAPTPTPRNLFGQVDGTVNPAPGPDLDALVWVDDPQAPWLRGGTYAVVRRIRMDLDTWDRVGRDGRELAIGRRLDTGAPLTGSHETDPVDLEAVDSIGLPVIPEFAHVRRARGDASGPQLLRRGYSYDDDGDAGLVFVSFQADVDRQFVPVQRRLDELDLLNTWTTPVGSTVVAVLPGAEPGGWVGETLLG